MRRSKVYISVLLLGIGLLGVYLGAMAQEGRPPWPPPPVRPLPRPITLPAAESPSTPKAETPSVPQADTGPIIRVKAEQPVKDEPPPPMFPMHDQVPAVVPGSSAAPQPGPVLKMPSEDGNPPDATNGAVAVPRPRENVPHPDVPQAATIMQPGPMAPPANPAPVVQPEPAKPLLSAPGPVPQGTETSRPLPYVVPIRRSHREQSVPAEVVAGNAGTPESTPAKRIQAPLLTLEKKGPATVSLGQPVHYDIVVHNVGSIAVPSAWIEDILPETVQLLGADPQPLVEGNRLIWDLKNVQPGTEQHLQLELQPTAAGDMPSQTSLVLTLGSNTQVAPPALSLTVNGPERVPVGKPAVFEVRLVNNGRRPLVGLVLNAEISSGLSHPAGQNIDGPVSDLPPGGSASVTLATNAVQPGRQGVEFHVLSQDREQASGQASVLIGDAGLFVQVPATARVILDRPSDITITVANLNAKAARNVTVTGTLPEGVEFSSANDRGVYRGTTRAVQWLLDYLPPQQSRTFVLKVKGKIAGEAVFPVLVSALEGLKAQAKTTLVVEGLPQLNLRVTGHDNTLEVGHETMYEIMVSNEGTAADSEVQVQASLPQGLVPRQAGGPARYRIEGQQVIFEPLARLEGKSQVYFRVGALAQSPGDRRLRVQLTSSQLRVPLVREERTWVYQD